MSSKSDQPPGLTATRPTAMSEAPSVAAIGMGSLFAATPIALVMTAFVIWQFAISWLWAVPIYALVGATLTLGFTVITWVLMTSKACAALRRRLPFMRQSS